MGNGCKDVCRRLIVAPTPRERERWHAVWLLAQGWTASVGATVRRGPDRLRATNRLSCSSVGFGPSRFNPASTAAARYFRTVSLASPVSAAMGRWLPPCCQTSL